MDKRGVMSYRKEPLEKYLRDAASGSATPGGGSVSALVGALGTTMASMSSNFTIGRERFKDVEPKVREILCRCDNGREKLLDLMEDDIKSYRMVSEAYALPRSTEIEKGARTTAIQTALKEAMAVPLNTVRTCIAILEDVRELAEIANPNLISDVGVAAILTNAALSGGRLNVEINLAHIKDEILVEEVRLEVEQTGLRAGCLLKEIMEIVRSKIKRDK